MKQIKASTFINHTKRTICLYEQTTGDIRRFRPTRVSLRRIVAEDKRLEDGTFVILDKSQLELFRNNSEFTLENVAIVDHSAIGRNGSIVSYLVWGVDLITPIVLSKFLVF